MKRSTLAAWRYGRHSNIPACCVAFYCAWRHWWPRAFIERWPAWRREGLLSPYENSAVQYVRCPLCLRLDRSRPIHLCGPACPAPYARDTDTWEAELVDAGWATFERR